MAETIDAEIEIFNPSGDRAEACGNGTRCIARILFYENFSKNTYVHVVEVYGQHHDIFGLRATFLWMLLFCGDISPDKKCS